MKRFLTLCIALTTFVSGFAVNQGKWVDALEDQTKVAALDASMTELALDQFLQVTPKQYREITGERLGIKGTLQLKAAQKAVKSQLMDSNSATDFPKGAYIVLVIIGWGFLPMGLMDDWQGNNWWVNLILSFLCWLPGVIHGLIKMKEYY